MNQPKFKFGDKVRVTTKPSHPPFIVCDIRRDAEVEYIYSGDRSSVHFAEEDLALYQEPLKKKLYAYAFEDGEIRFHKEEEWNVPGYNLKPRRSPSFDIEYPEDKHAR
jgi:hypothetical protein